MPYNGKPADDGRVQDLVAATKAKFQAMQSAQAAAAKAASDAQATANAAKAAAVTSIKLSDGTVVPVQGGVATLPVMGSTASASVALGNGVNLSGLEFGNRTPFDSGDFAKIKSAGCWGVRIPFLFEREKTDTYARLVAAANAAIAAGLTPILDHHGYARKGTDILGSAAYPVSEWTGNWATLAGLCAGLAVWFDLENEPHDMPAQAGSFTTASTVSSFDTALDGWVAEDSSSVTVTENTGTGVMTVSLKTGKTIARVNDGAGHSAATFPDAANKTLRARVRCTGAGGSTDVQAFVQVQDSSYAWQSGGKVSLTDGAWHDLTFTPSDTLWGAHKGLGIEFDANGATSAATFEVDMVDIGHLSGNLAPAQVWEQYSLQGVAAIRGAGATTQTILCEFYSWASMRGLSTTHPTWWHTDKLVRPSGHYYFDINAAGTVGAGTYPLSYTDTEAHAKSLGYAGLADMVTQELAAFKAWVGNQPGMPAPVIGEIGWPTSNANPTDYTQWDAIGALAINTFNAAGWPWMAWSAGENWGGYNLSLGVPGSSPTSVWTDVLASRVGQLQQTNTTSGGTTTGSTASAPTVDSDGNLVFSSDVSTDANGNLVF